MSFADELKNSRINAGMTQQIVSDVFEIPKRTIEDWERGLREPPGYVQKLLLKEMSRKKKSHP